MIKIVVPLFASIKNKNVTPKIWTKNPYSEKSLTKKIFVVPIKDKRNMDIIFKYTDETKYYKEAVIIFVLFWLFSLVNYFFHSLDTIWLI